MNRVNLNNRNQHVRTIWTSRTTGAGRASRANRMTGQLAIITPALAVLSLGAMPSLSVAAPELRTAAGANAAAIQPAVDAFRASLGAVNGAGGPFFSGRREINWDGAPDAVASPNLMPVDFFNNNVRRGAVFSNSQGSEFLLSQRDNANPANPSIKFGDINPAYNSQFQFFSPQRLFAARGSTICNVDFFVPNTPTTVGTVSAFGVVFTDVDDPASTRVEYYGTGDRLLYTATAPVADGGLSFVGVRFTEGERVHRVRIVSGNTPMSASAVDGPGIDIVAMDDFIFAEPLPPLCPADFDNGSGSGAPDGGVTIDDLLFYLQIFTEGAARADVDDGYGTGTPDYGVTIDDLLYFLARYDAGC